MRKLLIALLMVFALNLMGSFVMTPHMSFAEGDPPPTEEPKPETPPPTEEPKPEKPSE